VAPTLAQLRIDVADEVALVVIDVLAVPINMAADDSSHRAPGPALACRPSRKHCSIKGADSPCSSLQVETLMHREGVLHENMHLDRICAA
jgi:hypothetical protein